MLYALKDLRHGGSDISRALHHFDTAFSHDFHFGRSRIVSSSDDSPGMPIRRPGGAV